MHNAVLAVGKYWSDKLDKEQLEAFEAWAPELYRLSTGPICETSAVAFWDLCSEPDEDTYCQHWLGDQPDPYLYAIGGCRLPVQYVALVLAGRPVQRGDLSLVPMIWRTCETRWCVNPDHLDFFYGESPRSR